MTSMLFGVACGGSPGAAHIDGADASLEPRADGASGEKIVNYAKPDCANAPAVCDDNQNVRACVNGQPDEVLHSCPDTCSLGRCTTFACARAEQSDALRGCRFYGVQMDNIDSDDGKKLMLLLGNDGTESVAVQVDVASGDGSWTIISDQGTTIEPGSGIRVQLNRPVTAPGVTTAGSFRVRSDGPITAMQIASDDSDRSSRSTAGTVLRPIQALGLQHRALTARAGITEAVTGAVGSRQGAAAIVVVATEAGTHVKLGVKSPVLVGAGEVLDPPPREYAAPTLNEGDVLQIFSTTPDADLTGSLVWSTDYPVAVFSGNVYTSYGYEFMGRNGGDATMEQLPPISSWARRYVGARLSPQSGCDPFFGSGVSSWRVLAHEKTKVTIHPAPGVVIQGSPLSPQLVVELGAGEVLGFFARSDLSPPVPTDFIVDALRPVLVAQWLDCEPGLAWAIDARMSKGALNFALPPGFDHEIVVVRESGTPVFFGGKLLPDSHFRPISSGLSFEVARISNAELEVCEDAFDGCQNSFSGDAFSLAWRGMDVVCSYALTVPSSQICTLPNVTCAE